MFGVRSIMNAHTKKCDGILRTRAGTIKRSIEKQFGGNDYHMITANEKKIFQCNWRSFWSDSTEYGENGSYAHIYINIT